MTATSLAGKLALITGAGSGIGRATCKILACDGATVIAADQNPSKAEETISTLPNKSPNQKHTAINLNVTDKTSIDSVLAKSLELFKAPPSIIVNSAGITRDNFLLKLSSDDFDEVLRVNLKGTFLVIQSFAAAIIEHGVQNASIVNLASIMGKYGNIGQANYSASKAGVEALTKTSAKEFGKFGIRVNCVLPGLIETPMTAVVPAKLRDRFKTVIALGRFGQPEEVAEVIAFLASEKSSYVNGASIDITGGF